MALGLQDWLLWAWVAVVAAGLVAALIAGWARPGRLPTLSLPHVAAATLIAVLGWQALLFLPSTVLQFLSVSEIGGPTGQSANQAWVAAACVHIAAAVVAVVAILQRRFWAIVLGLGVAVANLGINAISTASMLGFVEEFPSSDPTFLVYAAMSALGAVPALVAIVLLLSPMARGRPRRSSGYRGDPASEREEGIIDADSDAAGDVEWPEWNAPAGRRN